jgi:hypothetical protein
MLFAALMRKRVRKLGRLHSLPAPVLFFRGFQSLPEQLDAVLFYAGDIAGRLL